MAVNVSVYSNANGTSRTISFDFVGNVLAANTEIDANAAAVEYYFKITTSARQDNSVAFPAKIVRRLSELVLNGQKQAATNTAAAYTDIRSMIVDYTYDYIVGHAANKFSSGVSAQNPMQF